MLEDTVRNLHYTVALSYACGFAGNVEQFIETLSAVFDLISKTLLAPTIFFIDSTAVFGDELSELADNSVRSFLFHRFHDKNDFVLSHEITSLSGLWLLLAQEQRLK